MACDTYSLPCRRVGETRNVAINFSDVLDAGELLTGTPTVVEVTTTALTLSNQAVNTAALTIDGISVAVGMAVQFTVAGGASGTTYEITITVSTDASQVFVRTVTQEVG